MYVHETNKTTTSKIIVTKKKDNVPPQQCRVLVAWAASRGGALSADSQHYSRPRLEPQVVAERRQEFLHLSGVIIASIVELTKSRRRQLKRLCQFIMVLFVL